MMHPLEGFMFVHADGSIWTVKGCYQPEEGLIAVPRVIYGRLKYKKLSDMHELILRYYRHYMRFLYQLGREVPIVPLNHIAKTINPLEAVSVLRDLSHNGLIKAALELFNAIVDGCSCLAGFSGSLAGGYFTDRSDIDLVVYSNVSQCYYLLRKLRYEGVLKPFNHSEAYIESLEAHGDVDSRLVDLMCRRVLQGVFKGFKYTVRLVNCEDTITLRDYITLPEVSLLVKVCDSTRSFTTPAYYLSEVVSSNSSYVGFRSKVILITHRIKFTELGDGALIAVHGPAYLMSNQVLINLDLARVELIS
ncbi:MAG: hypothetical protein RMH77_02370 [Sulfolobales archaeon]|nr:hypothetical protein [Sulfolobales archaeon]